MATLKKFLAFLLLFVLICAYVGSVLVAIIVVWPAGWYMALGQIAVIGIGAPTGWQIGKYLYRLMMDK